MDGPVSTSMLAYPRVSMKKRDLMAFKQETW